MEKNHFQIQTLEDKKSQRSRSLPAQPLCSVLSLALLGCAQGMAVLLVCLQQHFEASRSFLSALAGAGLESLDYILNSVQDQNDLYGCLMRFSLVLTLFIISGTVSASEHL